MAITSARRLAFDAPGAPVSAGGCRYSSHLVIGDQPLDHPLHLLVLRGELDQTTAPSLAAAMTRALSERKPGMIVDLTEVTSLDSGGLAALRDSHSRLARANGCLAVVSEQLPRSQAPAVIPTDATLDVFRTRAEAIAAVRRGVWRVGPGSAGRARTPRR